MKTSPAARAVWLVGGATILLMIALAALAIGLFVVNHRSVAHNRALIMRLQSEAARQDQQVRRAVFTLCRSEGRSNKACLKIANGVILPPLTSPTKIVHVTKHVTIQGLPGPPGAAGLEKLVTKLVGSKGTPGKQGKTGATGPRGATGPAGPQGPTGAQGVTGLRGPQGPRGAAGATGKPGPRGPCNPPPPEWPPGLPVPCFP